MKLVFEMSLHNYILMSFVLLLISKSIKCAEEKMPIKLIALEECKLDDPQPPKGFKYHFDYNKDSGLLNGYIHLPFAIDDELMVNAVSQSLVNGKWVDGADASVDGSFCDGMELYYPGIAKFIKEKFNLQQLCPMPEGKYEMKDWSVTPEESRLSAPPNFRERVKLVFSRDDDDVLCLLLEIAN